VYEIMKRLPKHALTIPDELLAWAREPDVAIKLGGAYARDIDALLESGKVLRTADTDRLITLLGMLCADAINAGRDDLLVGFDMLTAEWLGLKYTMPDNGSEVTIGRNERWDYQELRVVLACPTPEKALAIGEEVKNLVADVFPDARISAIVVGDKTPAHECAGCGKSDATVMLNVNNASEYCRECWTSMTSVVPVDLKPKKTRKARRR